MDNLSPVLYCSFSINESMFLLKNKLNIVISWGLSSNVRSSFMMFRQQKPCISLVCFMSINNVLVLKDYVVNTALVVRLSHFCFLYIHIVKAAISVRM